MVVKQHCNMQREDKIASVNVGLSCGMRGAYLIQVDDLGALLAAVTANAGNIEGNRGALGILNRIGDWALLLAHRARANTVRPIFLFSFFFSTFFLFF